MSRIAKLDVSTALERAAKNITDAAGRDGITSRKDIEKKLGGLSGTEKALTEKLYRFIDHRDYKSGARITGPDVQRALAYAKVHLLEKYDVNGNGYSKGEVRNMSATGQLAVRFAAELKGVKLPPLSPPTTDLGKAIAVAAKDTYYVSETDSQPEFISTSWAKDKPIAADAVMTAFHGHLAAAFDEQDRDLKGYTIEAFSAQESKDYLPGLATSDPNDEDYVKDNAKGFARIKKVFDDNLTDVRVFKVGPKDDTTGQLGVDQGAYRYLVLGRTADGKLAGISFESVET